MKETRKKKTVEIVALSRVRSIITTSELKAALLAFVAQSLHKMHTAIAQDRKIWRSFRQSEQGAPSVQTGAYTEIPDCAEREGAIKRCTVDFASDNYSKNNGREDRHGP